MSQYWIQKSSLWPHEDFHPNGSQAKDPSGKRLLKKGLIPPISDSSITAFSTHVKVFPFISSCNPQWWQSWFMLTRGPSLHLIQEVSRWFKDCKIRVAWTWIKEIYKFFYCGNGKGIWDILQELCLIIFLKTRWLHHDMLTSLQRQAHAFPVSLCEKHSLFL